MLYDLSFFSFDGPAWGYFTVAALAMTALFFAGGVGGRNGVGRAAKHFESGEEDHSLDEHDDAQESGGALEESARAAAGGFFFFGGMGRSAAFFFAFVFLFFGHEALSVR